MTLRAILNGWRETFVLPRPFEPAQREAEFLRHYSRRYGELRLSSSAAAVLTWLLYLVVDLLLIKADPRFASVSTELLGLHLMGSVMLVLFYAATIFTPRFTEDERYASRTTVAGCVVAAGVIMFKQFIAPFPYEYLYYLLGMVVLLIFCYGLFRLRARDIVLMIAFVGTLELAVLWYRTMTEVSPMLAAEREAYSMLSSWLLLTVGAIGYGIGVQFERAERQTFINEQDLHRINEALNQRNSEVEALKADSEAHLRALLDAQASLRAEAEQRNRDKSKFLASAVHDLRQPLQAISNALYPMTLAARENAPERVLPLLALMQTAEDTMRKQLSAILNLSRLESGLIRAEIGPVELTRMIEGVVGQQHAVALESRVDLTWRAEVGGPVHVQSDPAFIERILLNLIGNGIKYRAADRAQPSVTVVLSVAEDRVRVSVIDNGVGIDARFIETQAIFEPFFQADNHRGQSEKGVGLGLSIVRAMVANLPGHAIEVTSVLNEGSRFTLSLPRVAVAPGVPAIDPVVADSGTRDLGRCYVLLVEDDPLVLDSTAALFDAVDIRYEAYASFEQFREAIDTLERCPDVVISDFRLPGQHTAIEVIELARQSFPGIGAVVFSGEIGLADTLYGRPDITFMTKPLAPKDLLRAIEDSMPA
ncbi:MAG: ATP-binding protein [Pseudomonadota bacterium]